MIRRAIQFAVTNSELVPGLASRVKIQIWSAGTPRSGVEPSEQPRALHTRLTPLLLFGPGSRPKLIVYL